jgi:hypothetical protein
MVHAVQHTLMKHVTSFLLASGPLWSPPPPTRSWLSHNHLYSSPNRFPVESHHLLGCSHKIPNGASSAFDLSRCSTATSKTILGLSLQVLSWNVLPHAALGFFAGRGCTCRWSSPSFTSILLASRVIPQYIWVDAHKARARLYYQLKVPWCCLWIWPVQGSWVPIYSSRA